jgi:hypothetical protein
MQRAMLLLALILLGSASAQVTEPVSTQTLCELCANSTVRNGVRFRLRLRTMFWQQICS